LPIVGEIPPYLDDSMDRSALFKDINKGEAVTSSKCALSGFCAGVAEVFVVLGYDTA
jgi:hypothetical protein